MNDTHVSTTNEFEKDLKKLKKRFKTLEEDITNLIKYSVKPFHECLVDNSGIFQIPGFGDNLRKVFKVKKFASRSFKGKGVNSGLRLIYLYNTDKYEITLIEIYYKGDKANEDKERITSLVN